MPAAVTRLAGNEGVGEHVRPDFNREHLRRNCGPSLGEGSAPNEENLFLLPDPFFGSSRPRMTVQPLDLMSRRHPLSSIRALGRNAPHQKRAARPLQRRAGKLPAISVRRDLLLLDPAGLLRGLLHCALRLLLRFLSHIALRFEMA